MMFGQWPKNHRINKRLEKALIRLRVCAGWSETLLVTHTTLLQISCHGLFTSLFNYGKVLAQRLFVETIQPISPVSLK